MHGLVNRSIQCFLRDTYGDSLWLEIASRIGISENGFESMLTYDDSFTMDLLNASTRRLDKSVDMLLEDVGTYLVSHPKTESIRRLLRFGGETFFDFLHSLDDLPERARLAVPDLILPNLELIDIGEGQYELQVRGTHKEYAFVLVGVLRTMADDYGALVFLDQALSDSGHMTIRISLLDSDFSEGRSFSLARPDATVPEEHR